MYVNRPLVRLSPGRPSDHSRVSKQSVKQSSPNEEAEQDDRQLDNLEILYELEYKLEKIAGVLADNIESFGAVVLSEADEDSLTKARDSIEATIRKQIKRELDVLEQNETRKMRVQAYTQQARQDIAETTRQIERLKRERELTNNKIQEGKVREQALEQSEKQLRTAALKKAKLVDKYRSSQEQLYRSREELSAMDSQHFAMEEQLEDGRLAQEEYRANIDRGKDYEELERYKRKLGDDFRKREHNRQLVYEEHLEELTEVKRNIDKLDEMLQGVATSIYQQKCFIRAGEKEKYATNHSSKQEEEEEERPRPSERLNRKELTRQYEDMYLPNINEEWRGIRSRYSEYLEPQRKRTRAQNSVAEIRRKKPLPRFRTHALDQESEHSEYEYPKQQKKRLLSMPREHSSNNTLKLTFQRKQPSNNTEEINALYEMNRDRLKNKITQHIRRKPQLKMAAQDDVELVSVNDSEDDPNYEYVEMDVSKKELEGLSHRPNRS